MRSIGHFGSNGPLSVVVVIGTILSLVAFAEVRHRMETRASAQFSIEAGNRANCIVDGFLQAIYAIESVGAFYSASPGVTSSQFAEFTAPLLNRFPTITALGWVPRVTREERAEFERAAQAESPGFHVTEVDSEKRLMAARPRTVYFPVLRIQPFIGNEAALGFDIYSNPVRRAAIDAAVRRERTTSTARIRLVQDRSQQYSVLLINPVFEQQDSSSATRKVRGVASAVYRIGDGIENLLVQLKPLGINIWLLDRSDDSGDQLLHFHRAGFAVGEQLAVAPGTPHSGMCYTHDFRLGERDLQLVLAPAAGYFEREGESLAWLSLCVGLLITGLLAAYIVLMLHRSRDLMAGQKALEHQISEREHVERRLRQANQELQTLSREDSLTGISNRRHFDEYLAQEWRRAIRHQTPLSLLIGDLDRFKAYNDTHGHVAGDKCLRRIAQVLSAALERPGDLVARYGGEEIALVLPSTSASGARQLAEKLRVLVSSIPLAGTDMEGVTMSIGFGTIEPHQGSSIEEFVRAVDGALYRAKQQGRNRSVSVESLD